MAVSYNLDTEELARRYDDISDSQLSDGIILSGMLGFKPGDTVLDIGCGTGRLGRYLLGIIGNDGHYIGIDPMEKRICIAEEKNENSNATYRIGVADNLSFLEKDSVDEVVLNLVMHWIEDKNAALDEIRRVLKPGGRVGISTTVKELLKASGLGLFSRRILSREPYRDFVDIKKSNQNLNGLTTSEMIRLLADAGFMVEEVHVRCLMRNYRSAGDAIAHMEASSFGNYLRHVPESMREQVKEDIIVEIEKTKTAEGIQIPAYIMFAVASKRP